MKPFFKSCVRVLLAVMVIPPVLLLLFQHRLIYFPRPYSPADLAVLPKDLRKVEFRTSQGNQAAFYLPPRSHSASTSERVWVLFPGNAMRALDWLGYLESWPNRDHGFLLVDYPGYGASEGSASPRAIEEASQAAFVAWQKTRDEHPRPLKIGVLGLSLGCAAGLQFALHQPVDKVVLVAPFVTTLQEAKRVVGIPLCYTLRHRFDNRARLAEIAAKPQPPRVWIFHGADDITIPPSRGRELKAAFPQLVTFTEVPEGDHNTTLEIAQAEITALMKD